MKKIICLTLAVVQMMLCLVACGDNSSGSVTNSKEPEDTIVYTYPSEIPEYQDDKQLELMGFWSPPSTLEQYQWMVDCGFTSVVIDAKYGNTLNSDQLFETLAICDQVGIRAYVAANRGSSVDLAKDYSQFSSFAGFYTDEPLSKNDFETIENNMNAMNTAYPDSHYTYLVTLIGGAPTAYNNDFATWEEYYNYYFEHGGKEQEAFMMDVYPLEGNSLNGIITEGWLSCTEQYAKISKEYGVALRPYIATMSMTSITRRRPAEDDLRYQVYVNLAYGAKGISYFCYMSPGIPPYNGEFQLSDFALINFTDVDDYSTYYKTDTWYSTQTVNTELKAFEHILLSYEWEGVMKSIGSDAQTTAGKNNFASAKNWIKQHDGIKSISSTEDAIVGVFKDDKGYDGFMLVNFADPLHDRTNDVTIQFRGATRAMVCAKGEQQIVDLTDGAYVVTLEPGEGQFIIPLS